MGLYVVVGMSCRGFSSRPSGIWRTRIVPTQTGSVNQLPTGMGCTRTQSVIKNQDYQ